MGERSFVLLVSLLLVLAVGLSQCRDRAKKYTPGDDVPLFINTVGPYNNPSVTFEYYSLPFCVPEDLQVIKLRQTIGMAIQGDRLYTSPFVHRFASMIDFLSHNFYMNLFFFFECVYLFYFFFSYY